MFNLDVFLGYFTGAWLCKLVDAVCFSFWNIDSYYLWFIIFTLLCRWYTVPVKRRGKEESTSDLCTSLWFVDKFCPIVVNEKIMNSVQLGEFSKNVKRIHWKSWIFKYIWKMSWLVHVHKSEVVSPPSEIQFRFCVHCS